MQVVDQPTSLVDQIIQLRSIATGGRTLKRGEKHLKGRDRENALVHPDLIDREIPENFQEGKHYMGRGEGFPRGISWVYPGDLVVVRRCAFYLSSVSPLSRAHTCTTLDTGGNLKCLVSIHTSQNLQNAPPPSSEPMASFDSARSFCNLKITLRRTKSVLKSQICRLLVQTPLALMKAGNGGRVSLCLAQRM